MHAGYFKVYRPCFIAKVREIFVLMIIQFHRNESSWTFRSPGANLPRNESSLYGLFAPGNESAEERKGLESWLWQDQSGPDCCTANQDSGVWVTVLTAPPPRLSDMRLADALVIIIRPISLLIGCLLYATKYVFMCIKQGLVVH